MELVDQDVAGPKRDYVGYGRHVPKVRWPDGARVAVSFVLNYEEGSEVAIPAGDGQNEAALGELAYQMAREYRDLAMESVYEYGSRAGVWRLQRIFDELRVPITFFAAAIALERNLEVAAWLAEAGHEPCSHGWRWEEVWRLGREAEKAHMEAAIRSIEASCGVRPKGWYCRYGPSVHTRELLLEVGGFVYDSDAYNDDLPYYVAVQGKRHLVVPYTFTYNDARFVAPQGFGSPGDFAETLKRGFDQLWDEGESHPRMMSIGLHPRLVGQAARSRALREVIEHMAAKGQVWFARRLDIAEWWHQNHESFER